jgi:hypothetical protein
MLFDLMPVQWEVLGFSNRWYPYAVETAEPVELAPGLSIRRVSAVGFIATKLEAFVDRGAGDFLTSHDIEDVLNIVDGRRPARSRSNSSDIRISSEDACCGCSHAHGVVGQCLIHRCSCGFALRSA